jgi:hypothetical protein
LRVNYPEKRLCMSLFFWVNPLRPLLKTTLKV